MPQQFIKPVKDLYDASGGVVIANESKHQRATPEVDRKEHFSSFTAFNGIHLHNCNIGIGCNELLEVIVGASYMALLIDTYGFLLLADSVPDLPWEVDISDRQKSCIDVVVDGLFIKHDVIRILDAYVMDGLSLLHKGSNDRINTLQLFLGYGKALTAFTANCLVFLLGILGIIQMPLKLTPVSLCTSITDVWY